LLSGGRSPLLRRVLLIPAWRIRRNTRLRIATRYKAFIHKPGLDFLTAYVGEHRFIYDYTRRKRLAAFLFHLPTKCGIQNYIFLFIREIILREHSPHSPAPSAMSLEVRSDFRLLHNEVENSTPLPSANRNVMAERFYRKKTPLSGSPQMMNQAIQMQLPSPESG
jgi:hypothetical protein